MAQIPLSSQYDSMDCGPTCLRMIASFYGRDFSLEYLRDMCSITNRGVTLLGLDYAAKQIGFETLCAKISLLQLCKDTPLPCIIHWNKEHFVVLYKISQRRNKKIYHVADPVGAKFKYSEEEFSGCWEQSSQYGVVLCLEPTDKFFANDIRNTSCHGYKWVFKYINPYKGAISQMLLGLIAGSLLLLIFPFLTQAIVDYGIGAQNLKFIWLILIAQLFLIFGNSAIEFIRNWILLHIGTRINISLISDYITKLTKLPIRFFDTKMLGDVIQRIGDHTRIKDFITETGLSLIFSVFNVIILGAVILIYDWRVFLIFIGGTILYLAWVLMFMKRRAVLDKKVFAQSASNQSNVIQLVMGMQEIKLCGCEEKKRWEWEKIQAQIYQLISDGLTLSQYQQSGAILILQIKNALITALIASLTIKGGMTLGMMMAIQFIIGQLNNPVEQLISFVRKYQDAKLSLERLNDIYAINDEVIEKTSLIKSIPYETIRISNLCFKYDKLATFYTLNNITFDIPRGKTTAIVGLSGSGKTTLLKMILGFYKPDEGTIKIGNQDVLNYDLREWRMRCGVVMQDGFIFSDTIAGNIAPGVEVPDIFKLDNATQIANILDFIHSLPMGYQTKIGTDGLGLSVGQKQRILIARAVYKNPDYILMDEATNALDAENESEIICNMNNFLKGRTAVIIAHRLSTIRNADNIIVLCNGCVVEQGTHEELVSRNGIYHTLVKNQLNI